MARIVAVLNDSSGQGGCDPKARKLEEIFAAAGRDARVSVARSGAELRDLMGQAVESGCETLVAGGGDGTLNTAAQAVLGTGVCLGVLPLGTLNHFAKDLGIPLELEAAAQVVLAGKSCQVDVGEVNGRIFLNNSSLGMYPAMVRLRERIRSQVVGKWIAALWAALIVIRRNPFMTVRIELEGKAVLRRTPQIVVANNEYRASGIQATARESLSGGRLALYVLNAEARTGLVRLALEVLLKGAEQAKEIDVLTVREARIETRRRQLHVATDGEVFTLESPLEYRIRPGVLRVHVPDSSTACAAE